MKDDACRLSYKEGKEIKRKAERPYMKAAMAGLAPVTVLAIAMLATDLIDGTAFVKPDSLEVLLAAGDVSPALYDYLKVQAQGFGPVLAGALFGSMGSIFSMMILGNHISSAALKKANDEKEDED